MIFCWSCPAEPLPSLVSPNRPLSLSTLLFCSPYHAQSIARTRHSAPPPVPRRAFRQRHHAATHPRRRHACAHTRRRAACLGMLTTSNQGDEKGRRSETEARARSTRACYISFTRNPGVWPVGKLQVSRGWISSRDEVRSLAGTRHLLSIIPAGHLDERYTPGHHRITSRQARGQTQSSSASETTVTHPYRRQPHRPAYPRDSAVPANTSAPSAQLPHHLFLVANPPPWSYASRISLASRPPQTTDPPTPARPPSPLDLRRRPHLRLPRRRPTKHRPHVRSTLPISPLPVEYPS